ncbi:MAG: LysR family transcriptional regulator [Deltaproteobacteria bacterium]|nr:LysR family transcriptional regulator [Deltaproteobacteria bacterium]
MELRQLEYFVTVAEERNFTRAAKKLRVSQPGVSAQIRRLEGELGHELLDRSNRSVGLTEAGVAVLPYARAALGAVAGAHLAVDELSGLLRGQVNIGTVPSHQIDLPGLLAGFHEEHPAVAISLIEASSDQLVERLRTRQLDVAIIGLGSTTPAGISIKLIADEPIVAAVGLDHEWAAREAIPLEKLRPCPLISLPRGTGLRSRFDEACAGAGFVPRIAFEAGDLGMLARLASRGLGVAILPGRFAEAQSARLRSIAIRGPALRGRLALAWRDAGPSTPAARVLLERAKKRMVYTPRATGP